MNVGYPVLLGLFFLSGASSLAYQIAWARMLGMGLGHETAALLAVVAAIFVGLAAGGWVGESWLARTSKPGRWYGGLELAIGAWGLVTILLIPVCNQAAARLIGLNPPVWRQWLVVFVMPCVALLPSTMAKGATFPAMERFLAPLVPKGRCVGGLYAANTLGAMVGVLTSTWLVLPWLGFAIGLAVFAVLSLGCGAAALLLPWTTLSIKADPVKPPGNWSPLRLAATLFGTGLLGIGYEVLGVRILAQVLENTIYTFASVLAVFLLGTAAGGAFYQRWPRRFASAGTLENLLLGLATTCLLGVWILSHAQAIYDAVRTQLGSSVLGLCLAEATTAGLVFFGPTFCMGMTCSYLVQTAKQEGVGVGRALAINTLGSAWAPFFFGVALLPVLGAKWSFILLAAGYLAFLREVGNRHLLTAVALLFLVLALPTELRFLPLAPGEKLLSYKVGVMDSVSVVEHSDGNRSLLVNGRFTMGGTGAAVAERRHASIPLLLHPAPKRALFLGLGTGITFAGAGIHDGVKADGVELLPEIVQALPWFEPDNALPHAADRFRLFVADARRFVRVCPDRYDVIVADLFHPARDGAGALYSLEHFRAVRARLAPGGLFCQWLPLYQLDEPMLRVIIRTFLAAFPEAHAYLLRFNVDTPVLGLVGTLEPVHYDAQYFDHRASDARFRSALAGEQIRDSYHLFGCFLAGPDALRQFAGDAPLNTDDDPVVLFGAPRLAWTAEDHPYGRLLRLLDVCRSDPRELVAGLSEADQKWAGQVADFITARNTYLKGLVAETEGHTDQAADLYVDSARRSPQFPTGYARCLTLAMQKAKSDPQAARQLLERLREAQPDRPVAAQLLKRLSEH